MSNTKKAHYIPTLDGWRALAIMFVLFEHGSAAIESIHSPLLTKIARVAFHGSFGVDIFFAISGYLICTLLLKEKRRLEGQIDLGRFYVRRAFRILPPILVYLAALVVLRVVGELPGLSDSEVVAVLGFYRNYAPGGWYTSHFWSLAIEEHFYLIIPLLLARLRWRQVLAVAVVLSSVSVVLRWVEFRYELVQPYLPLTLPAFRTENRFDGLMNGAILALLLDREQLRDWLARCLSPVVVIALLGVAAILARTFPSQPSVRTLAALLFPLLIASTVLRPDWFASRWLELAPLRWFGRLSFSIYIWQQLFLTWSFVELAPSPLGLVQRNAISILPIMACAIASYYCIERPMLRLGHRLAGSPVGSSRAVNLSQDRTLVADA